MHTRTFEFEKMIIEYHYSKLPTKEDLEEVCSVFYRKAMQDKKEKNQLRQADSQND